MAAEEMKRREMYGARTATGMLFHNRSLTISYESQKKAFMDIRATLRQAGQSPQSKMSSSPDAILPRFFMLSVRHRYDGPFCAALRCFFSKYTEYICDNQP